MRLGDFKYMFAVSGARRLRGGNIGLRIFALVLAIGLWIFVNAGRAGLSRAAHGAYQLYARCRRGW